MYLCNTNLKQPIKEITMIAVPVQHPNTQPINYSNFTRTEVKQKPVNGKKILTEREELLKSIEFLTQ